MALLRDVCAGGAQVILATHSPVLAALPRAHVVEVWPWGIRRTTWDALELAATWRQFLRDPQSFLRYLG